MSAEDDEAARKLIANERYKLSATYLNGVTVPYFQRYGPPEGSSTVTTAQLLLMLYVPLGSALALHRVTMHESEAPDSLSV